MRYYISGNLTTQTIVYSVELGIERLCTYAYPKDAFHYLREADNQKKRVDMIIDSGAFTAWNSGKPVELEKLANYHRSLMKEFEDRHDFTFIALDVMPGEKGRTPTDTELKAGMKESYFNFLEMQEMFPKNKILPVYHGGEPIKLRDMFLEKTDHICLSMNQSWAEKERVGWASRMNLPGIKVHGLAATGNDMIRSVDWFSVDSATAMAIAAYGGIVYPRPNQRGLSILPVSDQSPRRKEDNKHVRSLPPAMQEQIQEFVMEQGFTIEQLESEYDFRIQWNIKIATQYPWRKGQIINVGLFADD